MRLHIKSKEDFLSGLMFIGFGLTAIIVSQDYPMGTAMRMGPGYFPTSLGLLLVFMGTVIAVRSLVSRGETEESHGFAWRGLIMLSLAFALFGVAMESLGFIPALIILIITSVFAGKEFRLVETIVLLVVLIVAALAIFIYGISLPFQLFWWS